MLHFSPLCLSAPSSRRPPVVFRTGTIVRSLCVLFAGTGLSLATSWSQGLQIVPTITTIAGNGSGGYAGDGGPATSAKLNVPLTTVHDAQGNMYIADYGNSRVRKVAAGTGIITTIAGNGAAGFSGDGGPATSASLNLPGGLALDGAGNLYIGDTFNDRVRKVNLSTGIITTYAGTGTRGFGGDGGVPSAALLHYPDGLTFDSAGNLYISDVNNYRLRKVTASTGKISTIAGTGTQGFSGDGGLATAAKISNSYGIAVDSSGNIYLCDGLNNRVRYINASTGVITTVVGTGTAGYSGDGGAATAAKINPHNGSLAIDAANNLYLADQTNSRIRWINTSTGIIDTFAGTGTAGYTGNGGAATSAQFNQAQRLEFTSNGAVYLADTGNNVIRTLVMTPSIFPPTAVGSSSAVQNVTLQVVGAPTSITSFTIANSLGGSAEYTLGAVTGCVANGSTLNAIGVVCTVPVTFKPAYPGVRRVPLVVVTNGGTLHFGLTGTGVAPQVALLPGTLSTVAGTGAAGYTGDGGAAGSAQLHGPARTALDYQGNVFIADAANNVVREVVASSGNIVTVAGNGTACATPSATCGDGGAATTANLRDPEGIAVDAAGNLLIADAGDNRIREVDANTGLISTVAGSGSSTYGGDGGLATAAGVVSPQQVAFDPAGNLYLADAGDHALRFVAADTGLISTLAGNGTACSPTTAACGDGAVASGGNSKLNAPGGIFRDGAGNLLIADTGDNRVRRIDAVTGIITTVAGTGGAGFSGDGGVATSALLNSVNGVDVDAAGDLYIADTGNQAIRFVSAASGLIGTIAGNEVACASATGACGDGGQSNTADFITPQNATLDGAGNLYIADTGENRVRRVSVVLPTLTFASTPIGTSSSDSPRAELVINIGNATLTVKVPASGTNPSVSTGFTYDGSSSCPQLTTSSSAATLPLGTACTFAVNFSPQSLGSFSGSLAGTDNSLNVTSATQTVLLSGTATRAVGAAAVASSANPSTIGQSVTLTATVTSLGPVPSGTVTFFNGGTSIGTGTVNVSGVATLTTGVLPIGSNSITVVYGGDANTLGATSTALLQVVNQVSSPDTLTTSNATPAYATPVTFTDTIPVVNGIVPTGFVLFYNGATFLGFTAVPASGIVPFTTNALPVGSDSITAVYAGDANYAQVTSNAVVETVGNPANTTTTTTLTSSSNPSTYGQSTRLTATVGYPNGGAVPTGSVTFYSQGTPTNIDLQATPTSTTYSQTLNLAAGTYSVSIVGNTSGGLYTGWNPASNPTTNNRWTDRYGIELCGTCSSLVNDISGDPGFSTDTAALSAFQSVATLNMTLNSRVVGQTVNNPYTFTLSTPQSVSFYVPDGTFVNGAFTSTSSFGDDSGGLSLTLTPLTVLGSGTLNGSAIATLASSTLPVGTTAIQAVYSGNTTYVPSSSTLNQVVNKATSTGTLTSSNTAPGLGQSITLTDTLPGVNGTIPTGTVTFYNGSTVLGTGTLNGSGVATLATTSLPAGTDTVTAVYGSDANFTTATSNAVTETVAKSSAADTLTTSNASPVYGQAVTLTDTIPVPGGIVPTGMVTFYNGSTVLGTGTVNSSGVATLATTGLPAGTDTVTAVYGGDSNYSTVTSNALTETVAKATPVLAAPSIAPVNAAYGTSVTITQNVPAGETGTVTFYNGATVLGTGTISNGVATLVTTALPAGAASVTSHAGGDANYNAAISPATSDTVSKATPVLAAPGVAPLNSAYGTAVTLTQTVPADETGTVSFYSGATLLGTATIVNGAAVLTTTALPAGTDAITGQAGGDTNYNAATSPATTDTVAKATVVLVAPTVTPAGAPYGTSVTITQAVPAGVTGTVDFFTGNTLLGTGTISGGVATLATTALPTGANSITGVTSGDANHDAATSPATMDTVVKVTTSLAAPAITPLNAPYGTSVTITENVPAGETGTVNFYSGTTLLGTGTISGGVATLTTSALPTGADSVTAQTTGDTNYNPATSPATADTVSKATTVLTAPAISPENAPFGTAVTITQAVPAGETGTVSFYSGATLLGTGTIVNGVATLTTSTLPAGTDSITGQGSGDNNYNPATSPATTDTVGKASTVLAAPTVAPANAPYGTSVTITQHVPVAETGTVNFFSGTTLLGTGTVVNGVATLTTTALPVGADAITAETSGDPNHDAATSPSTTDTVGKATSTLAAPTVSPANATYGTPVTITQNVPAGETGTVTFYDGATVLGTGTISNGVAMLTTSALPPGADSITTQTSGDGNYNPATSPATINTVSKANGADALATTNASPSYGQPVTFTDTVPVVNGVAPAGTVTFYSGATAIGTGLLDGLGVATFTTSLLPVGTDSITAVYGGDVNYASVTAGPLVETVGKTSAGGTLTSSDASPTNGAPVVFLDTFTIPVVNGVAPTGTITFYNGATVIGTGTLNAQGVATFTTGSLPVGANPITAVYGGDANYAPSTGGPIVENVARSSLPDVLTTSNPAITIGQAVIFTDTIPLVGGIPATGTVTFYSGATAIGTGVINGLGIATLTTSALPAGADLITAVYPGDVNYFSANAGPLTEAVSKAVGADTLTSSNSSPTFGQPVTFTDTIPVVAGIAPTGTVTFNLGAIVLGSSPVNASGVATFTSATSPVGSDVITAVYEGDTNYALITSNSVTELVGKALGVNTLTSSNTTPALGQTVTLTATIPILGAIVPSGRVTFYDGATAIGTGTVNASGMATMTTNSLIAGSHTITAIYAGDGNYGLVTSNAVTETVAKATGGDVLASSDPTPTVGQLVTFTETIPVAGGIAPTGTVTFYNGGTAIGTGTVSPSGVATLNTGSLPAGSDSITAVYGGDGNYAGVTSGPVTEAVGKATSTDSLATSSPSIAFGQTVTFTETVPIAGGIAPTGVVTFYSGSTVIGTGVLNGAGLATLSTGNLPAGSDSITTVYPGDGNYNPSNGGPLTEAVAMAGGSDTLTSSSTNPTVGQPVTFTDTIPVVAGIAPTGTVTFYDGATAIGTGIVNGAGVAALTTRSLLAGSDIITAVYGGDSNYAVVTSNAVAETVTRAGGADTLTSSDPSPTIGQPVTFTDTIPIVAGILPTGTVTFYNGATAIGTGTVNGAGVATLTTASLAAGIHTITALYSGDGNYTSASSGTVMETVARATVSDTLTSNSATIPLGQAVTFTDTIALADSTPPTGTVTFYSGSTVIGSSVLSVSGVATLTVSTLPVGTHAITTVYAGDTNYNPSNAGPLAVTVSRSSGADALTTSNPTPTVGQPVTFTDAIPVVGGLVPTGTVIFYSGTTVIGTSTVDGTGLATLTTALLPPGSDAITAVYSGDASYAAVTAGPVTETVARAAGADTLTSSNLSPLVHQPVTFTDTVPVVTGFLPSGTVTFYSGATAIGSSALTGAGLATLVVGSLPAGTDTITAVYSGDSNYASVTSNAVTETVAKDSGANTLTSSTPTSTAGQPVTFADTIPAVGGIVPTGTVTFYNGTTAMGTVTLSGSGTAVLTTGLLPVGTETITAVYSGDTNYATTTSNAVSETVAKAAGADTLASSNTTLTAGQSVTFTDAIPLSGSLIPTGTVTFYDGGTAIGTASVNLAGVASLATALLPVGTDTITATYSGDGNYAAATSNAVTETVAKATSGDVLATSTTSATAGQPVTLTDTILSVGGIIPTGTVTFYDGATVIGTGTVDASGVATLTIGSLPAGINTITAVYSGDASYRSSRTNLVTITVQKATTTSILASSSLAIDLGQPVTFTGTVSGSGGGTPTGTVTFYDGATVIGTGTLNAAGVATLTTSTLPGGSDAITAVYSGDAANSASTSSVVAELVVSPVSAVLTASATSTLSGQPVTLIATLTNPGGSGPVPTGTVTFYLGSTIIGTGTLDSTGVATLTTTGLPVGSDSIMAVYSGEAIYQAGTSNTVIVTVGTGDFTISATPADPTINPGGTIAYTVALGGLTVPFNQAVVLSASGLPPGATVSFSPATLVPGAGPTYTTMTILTSPTQAGLVPFRPPAERGLPSLRYGLLLLPLLGLRRLRKRLLTKLSSSLVCSLALLCVAGTSIAALGALAGCAGGYFGLPPHHYTITVTGTSGTLQHSTTVELTVR